MTTTSMTVGAAFFDSTEGALAGGLDTITDLSFLPGFWGVDLGVTAGAAFTGLVLATGFAADWTGFLVF
ncbi:hypothetical protein [Rhodoferax sp.]|uniref:hypothetical protein n=1 Tax=Rhodoferax sp. TaxID=50421 RepID=UPI00374D3B24